MKKNMVMMLMAAASLTFFSGCAGFLPYGPTKTEVVENDSQDYVEEDMDVSDAELDDMMTRASYDWLPAGVEREKAETAENEELKKLIIDYFEIPEDALADSRYYYNYVDLDSDGENEIFVLAAGSYTSGTGGSSALWCQEEDGKLVVKQELTLVNMPVIVVDNEEGGPKNLVLERSGGGAETEFVELICKDGRYTNVSDAEPIEDVDSLQGVAILCNDLAEDLETGNYLTLE